MGSLDISYDIAIWLHVEQLRNWYVVLGRGKNFFILPAVPIPALGSIHLPVQWNLGVLSWGVKWLGHDANSKPPFSAKVKNAQRYRSLPNSSSCAI
jgi:hypothetical protein